MKAEWILLAFIIFLMLSMPAIGQTDQPITCKQGNYFIQNVGQLDDSSILYYSDIPTGRICVRQDDIVFQFIDPPLKNENGVIARPSPENRFRGDFPYREKEEPCPLIISNVYVTFSGSDFTEIIPEDEQVTKINIFKGNDPNKWRTDIPTFGAVRIRNLYDNVDLVIGGDRNDSEAPIWHLEGESGFFSPENMNVETNRNDRETLISVPEKVNDTGKVSDDPELKVEGQQMLWGTYLGGTGDEWNPSIAIDSSGSIVVSCSTWSLDMPVPDGFDQTMNGGDDYYLAKLDSSGSMLLWGSYIGGWAPEVYGVIELDQQGNIVLAGATCSDNIPILNGYQNMLVNNLMHIYVAKLSASGNSIIWATFLEGSQQDEPADIIVDLSGNILIAGWTFSPDIPVPNGFDQTFNDIEDGGDIYVAKLSSMGNSLIWGTYVGGSAFDCPMRIAVDSLNNVIVAGATQSPDIPVSNGFDQTYNGDTRDIYVAKISSSGNSLMWGTFLGGSDADYANAMAVDVSDDIIIGGITGSLDMPVLNGYCHKHNGPAGFYDIYMAKLASDGRSLVWGTYIGGINDDSCEDLVLDSNGDVYMAGYTWSSDIPVPAGFNQVYDGKHDMYLAKISGSGKAVIWGSYIKGQNNNNEFHPNICLDSSGNVIAGATTWCPNLDLSSGYDQSFNGGADVFLLELTSPNVLPLSVSSVSMKKDPFRLKICGSNFLPGIKVFIAGDTAPWSGSTYKDPGLLMLKGGNSLKKKFPKGVPVEIKVVNGDGGTATITYTR